MVLSQINKIIMAPNAPINVINKGKSLFIANKPPKIKLNSVSKKLLLIKIFILLCQVSTPAPTNNSRPKNPTAILKRDKLINTNKITLPDSSSLKVW
jgi:hypothetical protein